MVVFLSSNTAGERLRDQRFLRAGVRLRYPVEVHQSQQTDRVVDVLIVTQQQVPMFQKVQKTTEFPHVALIVRTVQMW